MDAEQRHNFLQFLASTYPPRCPRNSFIFTLYWTSIPRFSFCAASVTLRENERVCNSLSLLSVSVCLCRLSLSVKHSQCRRGQVGVLVLQLTVQRQPPLVLVVGQQRRQRVHLVEGRPGAQRKSVPARTKDSTMDAPAQETRRALTRSPPRPPCTCTGPWRRGRCPRTDEQTL